MPSGAMIGTRRRWREQQVANELRSRLVGTQGVTWVTWVTCGGPGLPLSRILLWYGMQEGLPALLRSSCLIGGPPRLHLPIDRSVTHGGDGFCSGYRSSRSTAYMMATSSCMRGDGCNATSIELLLVRVRIDLSLSYHLATQALSRPSGTLRTSDGIDQGTAPYLPCN